MGLQKDKVKDFSDLELIEGSIKGKPSCQEGLYKRYFSLAMSICIRYVPSVDEAVEVVNDGFVKVFEHLGSYDSSRPIKAWIARIMVNTAIDSYRQGLKHRVVVNTDAAPDADEAEPEIEQTLCADDIVKLFAELPDKYRINFNLYEIEGYSHEEIGQMLGISTSTSRSNLTRAKKMLQKLYKQHINSEEKCHEAV